MNTEKCIHCGGVAGKMVDDDHDMRTKIHPACAIDRRGTKARRRGRPCLAPDAKRVRVGALIDPKVYDRFVKVAAGYTITQALESAIEEWTRNRERANQESHEFWNSPSL